MISSETLFTLSCEAHEIKSYRPRIFQKLLLVLTVYAQENHKVTIRYDRYVPM